MEGGHERDTASGDIVTIVVSPEPPYGAIFEPDRNGKALVLKAYEKVDGKFGPLQKHKGIHYGDVLFGINDVRLDVINFPEALAMLNDRNLMKKQLKFINEKEYYIRKRASGATGGAGSTAAADSAKQGFLSTVPRYKLNESGAKPFAEFEIKCQMRVPGDKLHKDIVHKWSIWRRYSEFEALNEALIKKLGWLMKGCEFPPAHNFSLRKLEPDFLEERKEALNNWWGTVLKIEKVTEFLKPHMCSENLKRFLEVDEQLNNAKISAPEVKDGSGGGGGADDESAASSSTAPASRLQKTQSMRRKSVKVGGDTTDVFSGQVTSVLGGTSSAAPVANKSPAPPSNSNSSYSSSSSSSTAVTSASTSTTTSTTSATSKATPVAQAAKPSTATASSSSKPTAAAVPASAVTPKASAPPQNTSSTSTDVVALPPKPSGARANLFADIQRRRIE